MLLALGAGAASALAFAPLDIWPLGLIGLTLLVSLVVNAPGWPRAALFGWLFGVGQFAISLNWIATAFTFQAKMPAALGWVAVLGLSLYLALFMALPAGLAAGLARKPLARGLLLIGAWGPAEWLRGTLLTGFAWNPLGAMWLATPVAQAAAVVGGIGLSLLALVAATALLWLGTGPSPRRRLAGIGLLAAIALVGLAGRSRIRDTAYLSAPVVVVQPGIGQDERYDPSGAARRLAQYQELTQRGLQQVSTATRPGLGSAAVARQLLGGGAGMRNLDSNSGFADVPGGNTNGDADPNAAAAPTRDPALIIWPEGAIDDLIELDPAARQRVTAGMGTGDLLLAGGTGVVRGTRPPARYANSLFVLSHDGRILGRYDKAHLVPLGEYVPWRALLEPLGIARLVPGDYDFAAGPGPRTLRLPGFTSVSPVICYEIAFPQAVANRSERPGWIANVSNDAWFGAWGPPQHLAQARLRAIEEGLPIARATPTGISAVIDGFGRILGSVAEGEAGVIAMTMPTPQPETLFVRMGLYPTLVTALLLLFGALRIDRQQPPAGPRPIRRIPV
ncbi:MAG: apolipoprotein N-acyltransferase [Sphingomonadales bacterium]